MDFITIIVVPFGAVLGAISIYYILGFDKIKEELEEGRKKGLSKIFKPTAKYIYVPLTIIVFILGLVYKGIGWVIGKMLFDTASSFFARK